MKFIITGVEKAIAFDAPNPGAFYANSNHVPAACSGAINADNVVDFLKQIASAKSAR